MKRLFTSFVVASLLAVAAFGVSGIANAKNFTDVDSDYFYHDEVQYLLDEGIVEGYSDGTFGYAENLNRAEMLKILVEAAGVSGDDLGEYSDDACFFDVKKKSWYAKYVCFAKKKGWVEGYKNGTFAPNDEINFVEGLKMSMEIMDIDAGEEEKGASWYKKYVDGAARDNLIPLTIAEFHQDLMRAEMAGLTARIKWHKNGMLTAKLKFKSKYKVDEGTLKQKHRFYRGNVKLSQIDEDDEYEVEIGNGGGNDDEEEDDDDDEFPEFDTAEEYSILVLNDEDGVYEVDEPEGYSMILFGDIPTDLVPDGVSANVYALVEESLLNDAYLDEDYMFYLEVHSPDDCWVDVINGDIDGEECPDVVEWYGPFEGPVFEFVQ